MIVILMLLVFVFMLVYTIYFVVDYNKEYGFFESATATVIDHQEIEGKTYDLLSYNVDGNEFRITTEYESKNDIGDTITIYYDQDYPLGVIYELDSRRIWLPVITSIFGVGTAALVVVYFVFKKGDGKSLSKKIKKSKVKENSTK